MGAGDVANWVLGVAEPLLRWLAETKRRAGVQFWTVFTTYHLQLPYVVPAALLLLSVAAPVLFAMVLKLRHRRRWNAYEQRCRDAGVEPEPRRVRVTGPGGGGGGGGGGGSKKKR